MQVINRSDLFEIFFTQLFNVNFTVSIYGVFLDEIVLFCLPNFLTYLRPPVCQLVVEEDVVLGEVLALPHAIGEGVPGGVGLPITNTEDVGVVLLLLANRVAGNYVAVREEHSCLLTNHPHNHLHVILFPLAVAVVVPDQLLESPGVAIAGIPLRAADNKVQHSLQHIYTALTAAYLYWHGTAGDAVE